MPVFKCTLRSSHQLVDLTPLVDVIFLLLIFFIITSDILPLKSMNVENPVLERNTAPLAAQLLVIVDAQNIIYVGAKKDIVDLPSLGERLKEEIERSQEGAGSEATVVLSVDKQVSYGTFLRVFSVVQECGKKVRLVYRNAQDSRGKASG
jgi:biopolymer transport protein ExbD